MKTKKKKKRGKRTDNTFGLFGDLYELIRSNYFTLTLFAFRKGGNIF